MRYLELLPDRVSFEKWLYPVALGGKEEEEVRTAWGEASKEILDLFEANRDEKGEIQDWIKPRVILVAVR